MVLQQFIQFLKKLLCNLLQCQSTFVRFETGDLHSEWLSQRMEIRFSYDFYISVSPPLKLNYRFTSL